MGLEVREAVGLEVRETVGERDGAEVKGLVGFEVWVVSDGEEEGAVESGDEGREGEVEGNTVCDRDGATEEGESDGEDDGSVEGVNDGVDDCEFDGTVDGECEIDGELLGAELGVAVGR